MGPIMQEVWLQVSPQHKTRIRLWVGPLASEDPELGRRIEIAHRIGVLDPKTDLISRFTVPTMQKNSVFVSEDNAYEKIKHSSGNPGGNEALNLFPSQASAYLKGEDGDGSSLQLSVALDRSHAVGSLYAGTLDVTQHRRGLPFMTTQGGTVVLDDTDRVFTQTWLSLGTAAQANRDRISMKLRLNNPLQLFYSSGESRVKVELGSRGSAEQRLLRLTRETPKLAPSSLKEGLHLQSMRSMSSKTLAEGGAVLVRVQHMFAKGEDPVMSTPQSLDIGDLFGRLETKAEEVTLTAFLPKSQLNRHRYPSEEGEGRAGSVERSKARNLDGTVDIQPFELRTFLVTAKP